MKQRTAKSAIGLLKKSFHKGETLVVALEKIKADMEVGPRLERTLEAKWDAWELWGEDKNG